ncbi:hypothetical protein wTpre_190 [Wolbachia endosymbiont of Trichogramma pretiosum]|nr:hypothetical protein wTpre_190 [Wolbachia endosymbiont of Trichogramma pretiosum]
MVSFQYDALSVIPVLDTGMTTFLLRYLHISHASERIQK